MQTQVGLPEWERGSNQLVRQVHRSQLECAGFFVQFVCGSLWHPNRGHRWSGKQLLCTPLPAAAWEGAVQPLQALCPEGSCVWGCGGGDSSVSWGDLATSFLIREGIIRVVRQNTWNLDLFWPSVVHAHTFCLFPGLWRGEAVCPCERLLLSLSHRHCSFLVLLLSARLTSFPNKLKG